MLTVIVAKELFVCLLALKGMNLKTTYHSLNGNCHVLLENLNFSLTIEIEQNDGTDFALVFGFCMGQYGCLTFSALNKPDFSQKRGIINRIKADMDKNCVLKHTSLKQFLKVFKRIKYK